MQVISPFLLIARVAEGRAATILHSETEMGSIQFNHDRSTQLGREIDA